MKMEHALVAPHAGVVRDLEANVGDQVEMGERIMRVEAERKEAAGRRRARWERAGLTCAGVPSVVRAAIAVYINSLYN